MRVLPWSPAQLREKNVSGTVSRLYLRFLTPVYLSKAQLQISYQCQYGGGVCQNSEGATRWFDKADKQADSEEALLRLESKNREYKACVDSGA